MAENLYNGEVRSGEPLRFIYGSFATNGNGAVSTVYGRGFTVARTAAGIATVTLNTTYTRLVAGFAQVHNATRVDAYMQLGAVDVASAKTIVLNQNGTDADGAVEAIEFAAADANSRIHFMFVLEA